MNYVPIFATSLKNNMKYLKIITQNLKKVPDYLKGALEEAGMILPEDLDPLEIIWDHDEVIVMDSDHKMIEHFTRHHSI